MRVGKHLRQLAGESMIYGISGTITVVIWLILTPLITRVFTPAEYGVIELVDVVFLLLTMFAVLGLDEASARWFYDSEDPADRRTTIGSWFWCQLSVSVALAAMLIALAPVVSWLVTGSSEYAMLVGLTAAMLPFQAVQRIFGNWLRYQRRAWAAVAYASGMALGTVLLVILAIVVWRQGLPGLYAARLAVFGAAGSLAILLLRKWISPRAFSWHRLKTMLLFGLPLVPAAVGLWAMRCGDRFFLKTFCDNEEVGLFALAVKIAAGVGVVVMAFTQAWAPFAFSILHRPESRRVYARVLDLYAFLGCGLGTATALFAPFLVWILAPPTYAPAASCVAFLVFGALFNGAAFIAALGSSIAKKSMPRALAVAIGLGVSVGLNFLLIPVFGRDGAAAASMTAWLVSTVYLFAASQRNYPIPYHWGRSLACLACSFAILEADRWLIPGSGPASWLLRAGLLLIFIPLGMSLGLIRWQRSEERAEEALPGSQEEIVSAGRLEALGGVAVPVAGTCSGPEGLP